MTQVWKAWLTLSCHNILFSPLKSVPSTGGLKQTSSCSSDREEEVNVCNTERC